MGNYVKQSFFFFKAHLPQISGLFIIFYVLLVVVAYIQYWISGWYPIGFSLEIGFAALDAAIKALALSSFVQLYEDGIKGGSKNIFHYVGASAKYFFPCFSLIILFRLIFLPVVIFESWLLAMGILLFSMKFIFSIFEVVRSKNGVINAISKSWYSTSGFFLALTVGMVLVTFISGGYEGLVQKALLEILQANPQIQLGMGIFVLIKVVGLTSLFFYVVFSVFAYRLYCVAEEPANQ